MIWWKRMATDPEEKNNYLAYKYWHTIQAHTMRHTHWNCVWIEIHFTEAELGMRIGTLTFIQICFLFSADSEIGHSALSFSSGQGSWNWHSHFIISSFLLLHMLKDHENWYQRDVWCFTLPLVMHVMLSKLFDRGDQMFMSQKELCL